MASEDDDIPESGAVFTFGKSRFADNTANKFWIRNDKVVDVSCGDDHTALATENGRLYVFGANDWGQLGLGHTKSVNKPSSVKALKHAGVVKVSCGRVHTLALTRDRRLNAFGAGGEGQLGMGDTKQYESPRLLEALGEEEYLMIACGTDHTAALTATGTLYTWGGGSEGQLGHGEVTEIDLPRELSVGVPVRMVSCGYYHSALITEDRRLFTFGEGEGGKLGLGEDSLEGTNEPQHVSAFQEPVEYVSCGNAHTAAITEKGHLYMFGEGTSGQLGLGPDFLQTSTPQRVAKLEWTRCKRVSCGESHTAVVTDKGCLYTFGDGRHGKLAQGEESFSNIFLPTKVHRFKGFLVEQVSCGGCHTLVRAHKRNPPDDQASDSEPDETEPKFSDPVLGAKLAKLAKSIDLQGSLNGSIGGTARTRRRQREGSPLPPLSRTLPPLSSSTPKASSLQSRNLPLSLKPLNGSSIPAMKLRTDEHDGRGGGGDEPDGGRSRKISDEDSALEESEEESGEERKLPPGQDPLATTHFSRTGTRQGMKPVLAHSIKEPPNENGEKLHESTAAPLDRRKEPAVEEKEKETEEEESDDEEDDDSEEEEELKPQKGKLTLSMLAAPKTSSSKTAPARTIKMDESEDDDDDDEDDDSDDDDDSKKDNGTTKGLAPIIVKSKGPEKLNLKTVTAKKATKNEESDDDDDDDDDEDEDTNKKKENGKPPPKTTEAPKKDVKPGTSKETKQEDDDDSDDDDDDEDDDDEGSKDGKNNDKTKTSESKVTPEEPEPKAWQFWKKKKKTDSASSSAAASPAQSTSSVSTTKPTGGDQGGSKACVIL